jgi:DNA mismatch repair protein MutS
MMRRQEFFVPISAAPPVLHDRAGGRERFDGVVAARRRPTEPDGEMPFHSILFDRPDHGVELTEPSCFADLNLDQVVETMTGGFAEYVLQPFFYTPLHDVKAVQYRHDVLHDLEKEPVRAAVNAFAQAMRRVREHLAQVEKRRYKLQKERWFLDGVETYCRAVNAFAAELASLDLSSRGFRAFRTHLAGYAASDTFTTLAAETRALQEGLAGVTYCVRIHGGRVTVSKYDGEADYSAAIEKTFAKFQQGAAKSYLVKLPEWPDMNHVDERVLEIVARLYPELFLSLDEFCARHASFIDETIRAFDREVQFYVAYLDLVRPLKAAGLPFCYPSVSTNSKEVCADDAYDLALAINLVREKTPVVRNDFALTDPERIIVVTGPNQGGKTTFARMFGELHYLASLGLPVPAREARLFLPDRIFTHFEKEEAVETLRGKLEDELVRIHEILQQATSESLLIMNESFSSTTLDDSLLLGTAVMKQIIAKDLLCLYVTFVDELASLGETVVSMVGSVVPGNPAERTFRFVRRPAEGLAYAAAIAEKYGLTYAALQRRIAR